MTTPDPITLTIRGRTWRLRPVRHADCIDVDVAAGTIRCPEQTTLRQLAEVAAHVDDDDDAPDSLDRGGMVA
jgi:hypothetical protein